MKAIYSLLQLLILPEYVLVMACIVLHSSDPTTNAVDGRDIGVWRELPRVQELKNYLTTE